jgi:hypothetical protein
VFQLALGFLIAGQNEFGLHAQCFTNCMNLTAKSTFEPSKRFILS